MNGPALLADHLDTRTDVILAAWREAAERGGNVADARRLSRDEFADHIPELLESLAQRLRGQSVDGVDEGRKHGQMRWRQGYDLAEMVGELGHLRETLMRATLNCAREVEFNLDALEAALAVIDEVVGEAEVEAVRRFQEVSRSETLLARSEADRRQEALEDSWIAAEAERSKLRTILDCLPVGVWVADAQGVVVGLNREAERFQGLEAGEVLGRVNVRLPNAVYTLFRPDGSVYGPDALPIARALTGEVVDQEEAHWPIAGRERVVTLSASPLLNAVGAIGGAVSVVHDITARKVLEAELAASDARTRLIVEQSPALIWRLDARGHFDFGNRRLCDFVGRELEDLAGDAWEGCLHPDDRESYREALARAGDRFEPVERTLRLLKRDGLYRSVTTRVVPFVNARRDIAGYLGTCLDITDRIDLERALEQQKAVAEELSLHKSRLLAALSHDARTPLNAVVLSVQLLEMAHKDPIDPEIQHCLTTIRNAVGNVLDLLNDVLNLTRIDSGVTSVEISRFEVVPTLAECLSSVEGQARAKGLAVTLDPDGLAVLVLETDRAKLKQILCNFLSNALRYTDSGSIRLQGGRTADQLRLSVEDTGLGIDPADQSRIFDEFATVSRSDRGPGEGTGLGLSICRRLASLLKGEILLDSAPGRGSTFTLVLPASMVVAASEGGAVAPAEAVPAPPNAAPSSTRPDGAAILIVEDHLSSRQALCRVLGRMGYRTVEAGNGRDALTLAREERPLAILMDVNLPIMDGIDATLALRADETTRAIPIYALTGDVSVVNQRRIGDAGVDGYLEKPVTREALVRALASIPGATIGRKS